MYLPKGNIIRTELENFIRKEKEDLGYSFVTIPHIAKKELYIRSGHMGKYDAIFQPKKIGSCEIKNRVILCAMGGTSPFGAYGDNPAGVRIK